MHGLTIKIMGDCGAGAWPACVATEAVAFVIHLKSG